MTLRQLMGHMAGVTNDGGDEGPLFSEHCERPVEALQHFAERSLLFEPGTQYRYSSYGWILVSAAVEAAADEPFLTFMRKQIFEPLGMRDTHGRLRDGVDPGSGDVLLPEVRGGSPLRPGPDARRSTIPATRDPAYSCPLRPTWCASGWRSTAASCCNPPRSNCSRRHSDCPRARRRVTVLAGTSRPSRWRVNKRAWSATTAIRGRDGGVSHDVPRARDRRVRDVEHLVRGHVLSCGENRAGLRGTGEKSTALVMCPTQ